jgi:hypothetical protein
MEDVLVMKAKIEGFLEILKARKRNDGEVWTQPSGRKVTKKNGKIIPVKEVKNKQEEPEKKQKEQSKIASKKFEEKKQQSEKNKKQKPFQTKKPKTKKQKVSKNKNSSVSQNDKGGFFSSLFSNIMGYFDKMKETLGKLNETINNSSPYALGIENKQGMPEIIPFNPQEGKSYTFKDGKLVTKASFLHSLALLEKKTKGLQYGNTKLKS